MTTATLHYSTTPTLTAAAQSSARERRNAGWMTTAIAAAGLTMALLGPSTVPAGRPEPTVIHRRPVTESRSAA